MFNKTKLRGPIGRIYPIFILSMYALGVIEFMIRQSLIGEGWDISKGPIFTTIIAAAFFMVMGIYQWYRYRLWPYPVAGILAGFSTLQSTCQYTDTIFTFQSYIFTMILVVIFVVATWPILAGHERYEMNARRLFKLAADSIMETSAGFTARPYSAGSTDYTFETLQGFARFLNSKRIVNPVYREQGIYMTISLGLSPMTDPDPGKVSYVLFDKKGEITVHISAFDYRQYTKRFTFDQLCESLGSTFHRFLEYYKEGYEERIINEIKSVR